MMMMMSDMDALMHSRTHSQQTFDIGRLMRRNDAAGRLYMVSLGRRGLDLEGDGGVGDVLELDQRVDIAILERSCDHRTRRDQQTRTQTLDGTPSIGGLRVCE